MLNFSQNIVLFWRLGNKHVSVGVICTLKSAISNTLLHGLTVRSAHMSGQQFTIKSSIDFWGKWVLRHGLISISELPFVTESKLYFSKKLDKIIAADELMRFLDRSRIILLPRDIYQSLYSITTICLRICGDALLWLNVYVCARRHKTQRPSPLGRGCSPHMVNKK